MYFIREKVKSFDWTMYLRNFEKRANFSGERWFVGLN